MDMNLQEKGLNSTSKQSISARMNQLSWAMIELNDPYIASHCKDVANLAASTAIAYGLSDEEVEKVNLAGYLHDIGKQGMPKVILSKPTKLTPQEFALVQQHVNIGVGMLEKIGIDPAVIEICAQHHERLDGSGYPLGLKGDEISLGGKILGVVDVVSALMTKRTYRIAASKDEVEKILLASTPFDFDAEIVKAVVSLL